MERFSTLTARLNGHGTTETDRRNGRRLIVWSLIFALALLAGTAWLGSESPPSQNVALAIAGGIGVVGLAALGAYRRYLREADELTRRIQLEGIAFAFGLTLLWSISYPLFETGGAPTLSLGDFSAVMAFAYVAGVLVATRRYK